MTAANDPGVMLFGSMVVCGREEWIAQELRRCVMPPGHDGECFGYYRLVAVSLSYDGVPTDSSPRAQTLPNRHERRKAATRARRARRR